MKNKRKKVELTRNNGTWSESRYWQQIRSFLRKAFQFWIPMQKALEKVKRKSQSSNSRLKWEYQCNTCKEWFSRKEVQIDHLEECGSLKGFEDLEGFIRRLTPESIDSYQVLCVTCHRERTNAYLKQKPKSS